MAPPSAAMAPPSAAPGAVQAAEELAPPWTPRHRQGTPLVVEHAPCAPA
ncbi:hypothetical protein [Sorangium sp. So ce388]